MKKTIFILTIALMAVGTSFAQKKNQEAIPGISLATNPTQYNNQTVTVKNVTITFDEDNSAPGANGAKSKAQKCNAPLSFKMLHLTFTEKPSFTPCFYVSEAYYNKLKEASQGQSTISAQVTLRGSVQTGYTVYFCKLGE
jgi:hypothetical protein